MIKIDRSSYHLFAWQGFAMEVPVDWNLAEYKMTGDVSRVRLHDDFNLRLELEWLYSRKRLNPERIRKRYEKSAAAMNTACAAAENMAELPAGWTACLYSMPDGKRLVTAFWLETEKRFFCLLKIHFANASRREGERIMRRIASTFRLYANGLAPWAVYDVSFLLHRAYRLVTTSFLAGSKLFVFENQQRRLYLFFFSLADVLTQNQSPAQWCAGYLNRFKPLSAVRFLACEDGKIAVRRKWLGFWGNMEPVVRGCLRYMAWCKLLKEKNQLFLGVCNYRRQRDLERLCKDFDPSLGPDSG
jgi:hypothetical protein